MANNALTELLEKVLAPFDEGRRAQMIAWVDQEVQTRPIVDCVEDRKGSAWKLGEESPSHTGAIIFAMLLHESLRAVVVYTFTATAVEDDPNAMAFEYFRETIFEPRFTHGPISGDALYADLEDFVRVDAPPAHAVTNGAAAAAELDD